MLKAVASVRDEVIKRCEGRDIDLETITKVFAGLTIVDVIVFIPFDTSSANPILGEFRRWSRSPAVYAGAETVVEIRYARHLSEDWRRFVVCKELCHSLETVQGSFVASQGAMDNLVGSFAIKSSGDIANIPPSLASELLAEAGALELLCPLAARKLILANNPKIDIGELAKRFNIPPVYIELGFNPRYNQVIEWLFGNG
jgi:hypothetical protein